jgi:hypothetical protein
MNWKKVDPKNLPEYEVIAASFYENVGCTALVGTLYVEYDGNYPDLERVDCTNYHTILRHCTHYLEMDTAPNPDSVVETPKSDRQLLQKMEALVQTAKSGSVYFNDIWDSF